MTTIEYELIDEAGRVVGTRRAQMSITSAAVPATPVAAPVAGPKYQVIDGLTGSVVGTYSCLKKATRCVDRKDCEHGSYRYNVRRVEA